MPESDPRPAPKLSVRSVNGHTVSIDQHHGRMVLVAFWGASCGPCLKELPNLERLADRFRDSGLIVLPVCLDPADAAEASAVASDRISHMPVFADTEGSARLRFDVQVLPTAVLIDRSGRLIGSAQGSREWDRPEMQTMIKILLSQP